MGFSFKKSFNVGGSRLNIGKKGASVSTGIKGFRISTGTNGTKASVGAGGVRYTANLNKARKTQNSKSENNLTSLEIFYSSIILFIVTIFCKIKGFNFWGITTWVMILSFIIGVISFVMYRSSKKKIQEIQDFSDDCNK